MNIDIEKLNRKMPYQEPPEEFFVDMQNNVLEKVFSELPKPESKTKIFRLDFKWAAAAAVILIAGLVGFWGVNDSTEKQNFAKATIVDSVYEAEPKEILVAVQNQQKSEEKLDHSPTNYNISKHSSNGKKYGLANNETKPQVNITDNNKNYLSQESRSADVEKVLVAFTPEQMRDIEKNSEQDVYLDLYN